MKILITAILAFLITFSTAAAGTAMPNDCSSPALPVCETVLFVGFNEDDEAAVIVGQRVVFGATEDEILSNTFIENFIDGLNEEDEVFEIVGDGTEAFDEYVGPLYMQEATSHRVVVGESSYIEPNQDAVLFFINAHDSTYIFLILGTHTSMIEYMEEVVDNDDLTVVPEDMEEVRYDEEASFV